MYRQKSEIILLIKKIEEKIDEQIVYKPDIPLFTSQTLLNQYKFLREKDKDDIKNQLVVLDLKSIEPVCIDVQNEIEIIKDIKSTEPKIRDKT